MPYRIPSEELLRRIAPCGLDCGKCIAFAGGPVHETAQDLLSLLGENFHAYAARFAANIPVFADYEAFRRLLGYLARGECQGCRNGSCLFQACRVQSCVREHKVAYCFQCSAFPCNATELPPRLEALWKENNTLMGAMGIEEYARRIQNRPRYP